MTDFRFEAALQGDIPKDTDPPTWLLAGMAIAFFGGLIMVGVLIGVMF